MEAIRNKNLINLVLGEFKDEQSCINFCIRTGLIILLTNLIELGSHIEKKL